MAGMISDWRVHAAESDLAKLVAELRPGELDVGWTQPPLDCQKRCASIHVAQM